MDAYEESKVVQEYNLGELHERVGPMDKKIPQGFVFYKTPVR